MSLLLLGLVRVCFYGVPLRPAFQHVTAANTTADEYCLRFKLRTTRIFGDIPWDVYLLWLALFGLVFGDLAQGGMVMIVSSTSPKRRQTSHPKTDLVAFNAHNGHVGHDSQMATELADWM
ncbi:hypothetical protein RLEG12_12600 [Rhizobium leguminosarum bv. trifolii CB782]|uniref:Uncharacterized protein n=1 Tax=Rhizobium hidalgonense TaxID=1538159 RepID=A0A2A6KAL3_9HYPH|nr:hypothetical protein [Rhizobium hidalgonense]AHG47846.1 hypothetical protein RLEG12_12600 [Rhizobium leguminosarum bv. trifolii CB782]MDR9775456.1 hypothetical protein [Rhizobium hidalgonense]MDR9812828.1 hypothetical protein [Rhizobium hidalgonense]MDR9821679.1 hypothetical protein [Rhizobium hidalgonense]PDT21588.1 hypothetical protein CO674_21905 [Rhizobium hidalgonense]